MTAFDGNISSQAHMFEHFQRRNGFLAKGGLVRAALPSVPFAAESVAKTGAKGKIGNRSTAIVAATYAFEGDGRRRRLARRTGIGRPADKRDKPARFPVLHRASRGLAMTSGDKIRFHSVFDEYPSRVEFGNYLAHWQEGYWLSEWIEKTGGDAAAVMYQDVELWGRREHEEKYYKIDGSRPLDMSAQATSELLDKGTGETWRDVRVVPALSSPDVGDWTDGISFKAAFNRFVLFAPIEKFELMKYRYADDNRTFSKLFEERLLFEETPTLSFENWFIARSCGARIHGLRRELGNNRHVDRHLAGVANNASLLVNRLARGMIGSDGFWRGDTRDRLPIDPQCWTRNDMQINLLNGDLVVKNTGVIEWASIVLRTPDLVRESDGQPSLAQARASSNEIKKNSLAVQKRATRPVIISDWLKTRFPERPPKTHKELMMLAEKEIPEIGTIRSSTFYSAMKRAYPKK